MLIRQSVIQEMTSDYFVGLRALGFSNANILLKHIIPNALLHLLPNIGLSIGALLGGSVIIENIFNMQGLGVLAIESIRTRDYAVIQAYVLFISFGYILINEGVNSLYKFIDPKLRLGVADEKE